MAVPPRRIEKWSPCHGDEHPTSFPIPLSDYGFRNATGRRYIGRRQRQVESRAVDADIYPDDVDGPGLDITFRVDQMPPTSIDAVIGGIAGRLDIAALRRATSTNAYCC